MSVKDMNGAISRNDYLRVMLWFIEAEESMIDYTKTQRGTDIFRSR